MDYRWARGTASHAVPERLIKPTQSLAKVIPLQLVIWIKDKLESACKGMSAKSAGHWVSFRVFSVCNSQVNEKISQVNEHFNCTCWIPIPGTETQEIRDKRAQLLKLNLTLSEGWNLAKLRHKCKSKCCFWLLGLPLITLLSSPQGSSRLWFTFPRV